MDVQLLCVGSLKEPFYQAAAAEYIKRLAPFCKFSVIELPQEKLPHDPSPAQISAALSKEAQAVRQKLPQGSYVVAMCVEGKTRTSEELAELVAGVPHTSAKHLVFLIGGSFGLDDSLKREADLRLSMSPMTFPHHLARVVLLEQLYRAYQINAGSPYHK